MKNNSQLDGAPVPALLGTQPQDLGALGALGALGPPMRARPQLPVGLLQGGAVQGPRGAQTERSAVVTWTDWRQRERDVERDRDVGRGREM